MTIDCESRFHFPMIFNQFSTKIKVNIDDFLQTILYDLHNLHVEDEKNVEIMYWNYSTAFFND